MKPKLLLVVLFVGGFYLPPLYSAGNHIDIIQMLNDSDWRVREKGIFAAEKLAADDQVRMELILLLERENKRTESGFSDTEISGEYYLELVDAVVGLKDPRSAKSLVGSLRAGKFVSTTVASFGEAAINPLIEAFDTTKKRAIKPHIIETLNLILAGKSTTTSRKEQIKKFILGHIGSTPSPEVKRNMVAAFANFPDDHQVEILLESLIASDTYYELRRVRGASKAERVKVFPIKEEARKVLEVIKAKNKK